VARERLMSVARLRERAAAGAVRLGRDLTAASTLSCSAAPRECSAVMIDAFRGERRLDSRRSEPASFTRIDGQGRVLDWLLHALRASDVHRITFVGGYHIQKVIEQYPELRYRYLKNWAERGEVEALRAAGVTERHADLVIARATSLCLPAAIAQLRGDDEAVSLGLYDAAHGRAAWVGLMHVPAARGADIAKVADEVATADARANMTDLIAALEGRGVPMRRVRIAHLAAPIEDEAAVAEIAFRGKARTLEQIRPMLRGAVVPESLRFAAWEWAHDSAALMTRLAQQFGDDAVVVRSSAACEDGLAASLAGRFRSVLNVQANQAVELRAAVAAVIDSFARNNRTPDVGDEIIVQRQVRDLGASGVLLTRDLGTGGPYYVLHVDRLSGSPRDDEAPDRVTAGVTSGGAGVHYVLRGTRDGAALSPDVAQAIALAQELEKLTCRDALDIEFGTTRTGQVNLFQVRPIAHGAHAHGLDEDVRGECEQIHAHLTDVMGEHPLLAGRTTVMSNMADWNPAEMLGPAPKPLALSLYQRLIGTDAWSQARAACGYRNVWPVPLVHSLGGRPYVDVRASLNSLLPAALEECVAVRLVDDGIDRLKADPSAHDKIEFEITHSCVTLDAEADLQRLRRAGIDAHQCKVAQQTIATLTDGLLLGTHGGGAAPMSRFVELERVLGCVRASRSSTIYGAAAQLQITLAECSRRGVLPFAVVARRGFVALAMLGSLRLLGVMSNDEHDAFLKAIPTIASELDRDLSLWGAGKIAQQQLLDRYGHLRPNSYDITSQRYADAWDSYFGDPARWRQERAFPDVEMARAMLRGAGPAIERLLRASGLTAPFEAFCEFIISSIQWREHGKFVFMKAVHDVLELSAEIGRMLGFEREDMAMLPVATVEVLATGSPSGAVGMEWRRQIEFNRKRWALTSALRLPGLIRTPSDVFAFEVEGARPTFVSQTRVSGSVVRGDDERVRPTQAEAWRGAVVLLRAADPGYDWLFSKGIAGLITAWGGAGSHMAIRAAEFGLPAAIGCGELMFESLMQARTIELDCGVQTIRVLA
jgi:phosphohistidine swiveling domain-containing protein